MSAALAAAPGARNRLLRQLARQHIGSRTQRLGVKVGYAAAGLVIALVSLMVVALAHFWAVGRPLSTSIGEAATTLLLIAGALAGAGLGFGYEARRRKRRAASRS